MPELASRVFAGDAVNGQPVVAALGDLAGPRAPQHVDDVASSEALSGANDRRQYLLGNHGSVYLIILCHADIARPAVLLTPLLAEVPEHRAAPAVRTLAEVDDLIELGRRLLPLGRLLHLLDEVVMPELVAIGIEQHALARQTVAPGAPRLLVVALYRFWERIVDDEADIGLVDAHPEGNGCRR